MLLSENRFKLLAKTNKEGFEKLLEEAQKDVWHRWNLYQSIAGMGADQTCGIRYRPLNFNAPVRLIRQGRFLLPGIHEKQTMNISGRGLLFRPAIQPRKQASRASTFPS